MAHVPRRDWKPDRGEKQDRVESFQASLLPSRQSRFSDTFVELVEPRTAKVLASTRFRVALTGFLGGDRAYAHKEDNDGLEVIEIYQMKLVQR
jgi:hypothetical protein